MKKIIGTWLRKSKKKETLYYKIIESLIWKILKCKYWLRYGHFVRNKDIKEYFKTHKEILVNFGCGGKKFKGFLNSDVFGRVPIDIRKKLPFKNSSVDLIYSNHVIEHIYKKDFENFLGECARVLKKKGVMIHSVPSLEKLSKIFYCDPKKDEKIKILLEGQSVSAGEEVKTGSEYINNTAHKCFGHKYMYDFAIINLLGKKNGLEVTKIENYEAEKWIKNKVPKFKRWNLETETFLFKKQMTK